MDPKARHEAIINRIRKELEEEGFELKNITEAQHDGPGAAASYFEYLVDLKLEGKTAPDAQTLWEQFKAQLNHYQRLTSLADKEYEKLASRLRTSEKDRQELLEEVHRLRKEK